jgi:hypothetical protein
MKINGLQFAYLIQRYDFDRSSQILHVKPKAKVIYVHAIKVYGEGEVWLHTFLATPLHGGTWSASRLDRFATGKLPAVPL